MNCTPLELARLPWENWEIATEFGASNPLRIARTSTQIQAKTPHRQRRGRMRILVIFGDETGLDFQVDREATQRLAPIAEVQFIGNQTGHPSTQIRSQICTALADPQGWDMLFFSDHSHETLDYGGRTDDRARYLNSFE